MNTCPVCGKGDSEQFLAGYEDEHEVWGGRYVSHLVCVLEERASKTCAVNILKIERQDARQRAEQAEAELAALKERRCETCWNAEFQPPDWYLCSAHSGVWDATDCCSHWAERGT